MLCVLPQSILLSQMTVEFGGVCQDLMVAEVASDALVPLCYSLFYAAWHLCLLDVANTMARRLW